MKGVVNASYDIVGYGFSNPEVLGKLPGPGRFDRTTMNSVLEAANDLQTYLRDHAGDASITPVPFQVLMSTAQLDSPIDSVQATIFAMRQIAAGRTLDGALKSANAPHVDATAVRSIYAKMVKDPVGKPSAGEVAYADAWLKYKRT